MFGRGLGAACAALVVLAIAATAEAAPSLQSHRVEISTAEDLEALAREGFDVNEGRRGNTIEVSAPNCRSRSCATSA
jgi:hypothetical protein